MQRQNFLLRLKNDLFKKRKVLTDTLFVFLLILAVRCAKPSVSPQAPATPAPIPTPTGPTGVAVSYSLERQRTYGTFGTSPSAFVRTQDGGSVIVSTETNAG